MMVLQSSLDTLPMTCRGGDHCCARNDVKLCGDNNCPQSVRNIKIIFLYIMINYFREASGTLMMTAAPQNAPPLIHVKYENHE